MEIIVKGVDQISPVMKKIKGDTGGVTSFMEANWKKVGLATAGAATAIEMFARKQAPMLEKSRQIAAAIGMNEKAFRALAIEAANVTFPLKDVLDLMELGKQAGLDSADSLKEYATFWDTVGDATGESAVQLGKMGVSLRGIGIELGNEKEALAAFGYITESTSGSINDFLMFLDKCGPELREMNMDVNQSASILGILEKEFGMSARTARTEFMQAVIAADGSMDVLLETLGISEDTFKQYSAEVVNSSEVIQRNADIHAKSYTPIQKLQHAVSELGFKFAGTVEQAAKFAPALYLVGPAMKLVSLGSGLLSKVLHGNFIPAILASVKSAWAFTAALLANPLTWWIIGITAVIAAIILLYQNWDKVTAFISRTIDWIGEKVKWLGDAFKWVAEKLGIYKEKTTEIIEETDTLKESVDAVNESIDDLAITEEEAVIATELLTEESEGLGTALEGVEEKAGKASDAIKIYAEDVGEDYIQLAVKATDSWEDFYAFWEAEAKRTAEVIKDVNEEVAASAAKTKPSNLYKIVDAEGNTIGLQTGNIISQAMKDEGVTLIKLHTGGMVKTTIPGGEGIAVLKDREIVSEGEIPKSNQINITIQEGAFKITANKLDEGVIKNAGKLLFEEIFDQFRAHNIQLVRG